MQGRVKQLRMSFGLDQRGFAGVVGCPITQVQAWETESGAVTAEVLAMLEGRFGVSPRWLVGEQPVVWSEHMLELRAWLGDEVKRLKGSKLVAMISATTGERIAYVVNLLRKKDPQLFALEVAACWLGLTPGSTELLLRGELDPGSPIIARASDFTGIPERWFRLGPVEML